MRLCGEESPTIVTYGCMVLLAVSCSMGKGQGLGAAGPARERGGSFLAVRAVRMRAGHTSLKSSRYSCWLRDQCMVVIPTIGGDLPTAAVGGEMLLGRGFASARGSELLQAHGTWLHGARHTARRLCLWRSWWRRRGADPGNSPSMCLSISLFKGLRDVGARGAVAAAPNFLAADICPQVPPCAKGLLLRGLVGEPRLLVNGGRVVSVWLRDAFGCGRRLCGMYELAKGCGSDIGGRQMTEGLFPRKSARKLLFDSCQGGGG